MSLSLRLNVVAVLFFIIVLVFGVQSILKTSVHYIQQQQKTSLELARQVIEAKISLLETYPVIEVRPEKLPGLFKVDAISDSEYLIIELFDHNGERIANNEQTKAQQPAIQNNYLYSFLADLFEPVEQIERTLVVRDQRLATVVLRPDRPAELTDVWSDAVEKLIPIVVVMLIIWLFTILFTTVVLKPVLEFIRSVQHQKTHDNAVGFSRLRELFGLSKQLKGIDQQFKSSTDKVDHLNRRLLHLQEEERRRISAELHDELGQHLTAIRFESAAISSARNLDETKQSAEAIDDIGREMRDVIRSMLIRLRPPELSQLGLLGALKEMVGEWQFRNPETNLYFDCKTDIEHLDIEIQHNIYRIIQEALTNISKHAGGGALNIQLRIERGEQGILFVINDDGNGVDLTVPSNGHGIKGMRERVETFAGQFFLRSEVGKGTQLHVVVPV